MTIWAQVDFSDKNAYFKAEIQANAIHWRVFSMQKEAIFGEKATVNKWSLAP